MEKELKEAITTALAHTVLKELEGDKRDAILAEGIAKALDGWEAKAAYRKIVEDRAKAIAAEVIATGKYDEQIRAAVETGFLDAIAGLSEASKKAFQEAIFGKASTDGRYDNPGLVLRYMK